LRDESTYMQWYITHTIRYISPIDTSKDDVILICTHFILLLFILVHYFFLNSYINYFFKQQYDMSPDSQPHYSEGHPHHVGSSSNVAQFGQ